MLPPDGLVHVRVSIGGDGRVVAGCVVEPLHQALAERIVDQFVRRGFDPATRAGRPVATITEVAFQVPIEPSLEQRLERGKSATSRNPPPNVPAVEHVWASTDVAMLEQVAGPGPTPGAPSRQVWTRQKALRTAAIARLGALGTTESLAAVDRIVAAAMPLGPASEPFTATEWVLAAWHFGDGGFMPLAETTAPDGTTYIIVPGNLYGRFELFLLASKTPNDKTSWSRPRLTAAPSSQGASNGAMAWENGVLTLTLDQAPPPPRGVMEFRPEGDKAAPSAGPQTRTIVIEDVWRDSDKDSLTDIEERRIGTDPGAADTDGDGIADGFDTCPLLAAPKVAGPDDTREILQAAFFATLGISRSRMLITVRPNMPKLHLAGYLGPVIFSDTPQPVDRFGSPSGDDRPIWLDWTIVPMGDDQAVVLFNDVEGMLAAGGQNVYLKKLRGKWYVVAQQTTWIS